MTETGMMSRQGLISPMARGGARHIFGTHTCGGNERNSCTSKEGEAADVFLILDRVGRRC